MSAVRSLPRPLVLPSVFSLTERIRMADAADEIEDLAARFDVELAEMVARWRWAA